MAESFGSCLCLFRSYYSTIQSDGDDGMTTGSMDREGDPGGQRRGRLSCRIGLSEKDLINIMHIHTHSRISTCENALFASDLILRRINYCFISP